MFEAKCVNPDCPANAVWILTDDDHCASCGHELADRQVAPPQRMADPDQVPDPTGLTRGG